MGYTNYFYTKKVSEKKFENFVNTCKVLHSKLPKTTNIAGGYFKDDTLVICGGDGTGDPVFNKEMICFNGNKDQELAHETFFIESTMLDGDFNFCKTARKPYDLLVCACLIAAKKELGYVVKTDGNKEDWKSAIDFYNKVTGCNVTFENIVTEI